MRFRRSGRGDSGIEDRRGRSGRGGGGFPGGVRGGVGGLGLVGVIVAILLTTLLGGGGGGFGIDPSLDGFPAGPAASGAEGLPEGAGPDADLVEFVGAVLGDVQASWADSFAGAGRRYAPARLVIFRGSTDSGCGRASAATGPFYCPPDARVYLDLAFFRELRDRFGAPGDFAQAYVIAHEVGHHVQSQLGVARQVRDAQRREPDRANELSVRLELQADCLAGVWAYTAYRADRLEPGDLEEGLAAAASVGDDRIQQAAGGRVDPESFTHGTSAQRVEWFQRGFAGGELARCDTFSGDI